MMVSGFSWHAYQEAGHAVLAVAVAIEALTASSRPARMSAWKRFGVPFLRPSVFEAPLPE
jgi:hypothetical protein